MKEAKLTMQSSQYLANIPNDQEQLCQDWANMLIQKYQNAYSTLGPALLSPLFSQLKVY